MWSQIVCFVSAIPTSNHMLERRDCALYVEKAIFCASAYGGYLCHVDSLLDLCANTAGYTLSPTKFNTTNV